jgi:hypothetical protein
MARTDPQKPYAQLSRTAKFYRDNPKSRAKHRTEAVKISLRPAEKKRKAQRDKFNNDRGGTKKGMDAAHQKDGSLKYEDSTKNRGDKDNSAGDKRARGGSK